MVLAYPEAEIIRAISANSGFYTLPVATEKWNYGLQNTGVTTERLKQSFATKLFILLGDQDTDPTHEDLPTNDWAQQQGPHRLSRGQNFYDFCKAKELQAPFEWEIEIAEGGAHSNSGISEFAVELLKRK